MITLMIYFILGLYKMIYGHGDMWETFLSGMAELVGTAMLVFLGCGGCIGSLGVVPSHLQITLTFGFAVMIVIQVCMFTLKLFLVFLFYFCIFKKY